MADDHERRLADIEKRLARLEKEAEKPAFTVDAFKKRPYVPSPSERMFKSWCECGRDVCRAPDCPSHKPDPLGR
jgi:hypothetical protein